MNHPPNEPDARAADSAQATVNECLRRIREREPAVRAWAHLDEAGAVEQARELDRRPAAAARGPLHGVPVGIKDIIDVAGLPTGCGTPLHAGRIATQDAWVVAALRAAGAVVMGKTVTTELATYSPGKTRNPHDAARTPGGSSSGSAAAVAAGMVPLALGTQTNGSVIRPAAYCGVYGFKPTHGWIPRSGVHPLSRTLDTVGVFARTLEDIALAGELLVGHDPGDPDTRARARPPMRALLARELAAPPRVALVRTPLWPRVEAPVQRAMAAAEAALGANAGLRELPEAFHAAWDWHRTIMECEMAFNLQDEWDRGREQLSASLQGQLGRGREASALAYQQALARIAPLYSACEALLEGCDAILTPSAFGLPPPAESTGDPSFCTLWSLCGMPALNIPLAMEEGLPVGLQLVGRRGGGAAVLRVARWMEQAGLARPQAALS